MCEFQNTLQSLPKTTFSMNPYNKRYVSSHLTLDRPSGGLLCALIAAVLAALGQREQFARLAQPRDRPQRGGHRRNVRRSGAGTAAAAAVRRHHFQLIGFDIVVQVVAEETYAFRVGTGGGRW